MLARNMSNNSSAPSDRSVRDLCTRVIHARDNDFFPALMELEKAIDVFLDERKEKAAASAQSGA